MYLLPLASTAIKIVGPKMGVRLLLLAALGLGALYSIHLLAGDWMKFQSAGMAGNSINS